MMSRNHINCTHKEFVLSLDVGTTNVRSHVYNKHASLIGEAYETIGVIYGEPGLSEIEPELLWQSVVNVCKSAVKAAGIDFDSICAIGISCLRNTFVLWDKSTGKCLHNFITWKDSRCKNMCEEMNRSFKLRCLRTVAKILYLVTRNERFLLTSLMRFVTGMVAVRLIWVLKNTKNLREMAMEGKLLYGTVDTWLVWKLTGGAVHATDPSNACVSGFFDPFRLEWSSIILSILNIPESILPEIRETDGDYGFTKASIFGVPVRIGAIIGDQQAAMFGECCFNVGDVKCTLGTGSFMNINTGNVPHASYKGLYPLVGWWLCSGDVVYLAEGSAFDAGTTITWAQNLGFFNDPSETSDIVQSVDDSGGVYFVPAFSGIQAPINDPTAVSSFIGISQSTKPAHLIRAILESLAFRVKQIYEIMIEESDLRVRHFRYDNSS